MVHDAVVLPAALAETEVTGLGAERLLAAQAHAVDPLFRLLGGRADPLGLLASDLLFHARTFARDLLAVKGRNPGYLM